MTAHGVKEVEELLTRWDIRVLMVVSLLIQVFLTLLAPLRKRCASGFLGFVLWLLYLSATAVALYVISQISGGPQQAPQTPDLLAFWSPFLLLHLGGPDTITALALEDNELWHRHALELVTQVVVTFYVFFNSVLRPKSLLWLPTTLMFIDGLIKYIERTQALYYASIDSFRDTLEMEPEPGPNYSRLMDEYHYARSAYMPTELGGDGFEESNIKPRRREASNDPADNEITRVDCDEKIQKAFYFYNKFKGLLADAFLSFKDRKESSNYFQNETSSDAFRIIEIELNFIYDVFYTKAFLLQTKQSLFRILSFLSVVASLLWFCFWDKRNCHTVDVVVTFILLGGAIALDICGVIMFLLSDWWLIVPWCGRVETIISKLCWYSNKNKHLQSLYKKLGKLVRRARRPHGGRWSRTLSHYNLLKHCFKYPPSCFKYIFIRKIRDVLIGWLYVRFEIAMEEQIVKFIVDELKMKARFVGDDLRAIKEVCSSRGNLFCEDDCYLISEYLSPWTMEVDYDESLLTWHLATNICYLTTADRDYSSSNANEGKFREISNKLSNYMCYLLLRQQTLVSPVVGMSERRFADTCAEARKFFPNERLDTWSTNFCRKAKQFMCKMVCRKPEPTKDADKIKLQREMDFLRKFCENLLAVKAEVKPTVAKGDKSKSVLFEACRLAHQLNMLGDIQWKITSKVWAELLSYAAVRCAPRSHVAQLNKGGELITLVWLLMAHLGLGDRFLQDQGFGWTKLIIGK